MYVGIGSNAKHILDKTLRIEYPKNKPGTWRKSSNGIQEHFADRHISE